MIIFEYPSKKVLIVSHIRTGSSILHEVSQISDELTKTWDLGGPLSGTDAVGNDAPSNLEYIINKHQNGWEVVLSVKDPHQRRLSALQMKVQGHRFDHHHCAGYIKGLVDANMLSAPQTLRQGYFDYTLNDGHMDWGSSCFYHLLVCLGVIPKLLFLRHSDAYFDMYFNIKHYPGQHEFTQYMKDLIKESPEVMERFENITNDQNSKFQSKHEGSLSSTEYQRMFLYDVYKNYINHKTSEIYEITDQFDFNNFLSLSEWENMETEMHNYMLRSINQDHETRTLMSKLIFKRVLDKLKSCYGNSVMSNTNNPHAHYPGKMLLTFMRRSYSVDKFLSEYLTT